MPKVWYSSYTSQVRVSFQIRTLLTSIPLTVQTISCSQDSVYRAGPDIPKLSAGQGLSSHTMNRSTHPRHSSREVFAGTWKLHHGRVGIAGMLCHHLQIALWLHVWEFLMASRMGRPWGFLRLSLLECFTCFSLHPYSLPHLGFDFCGAKLVKGADDKIPMLYFACFLSSLLMMPDLSYFSPG